MVSGENQGVSSFPTHLDRIIAQTRCCFTEFESNLNGQGSTFFLPNLD
ncbi:hypothetical protein Krac_5810 [Ktedonobacter racemifer DSM 44963]|uniref:Uncharacterized protein n=1 Tax=Ktedonobacter racemifer DSM 44963 TaxID=485913 RepID=D6TWX6_KTERA|nr:hypothetical protein Krac_5810 [Ktedonobacter racemifer DSM 44963]